MSLNQLRRIDEINLIFKKFHQKHFRHYDSELFEQQLDSAETRLKIDKIEYI